MFVRLFIVARQSVAQRWSEHGAKGHWALERIEHASVFNTRMGHGRMESEWFHLPFSHPMGSPQAGRVCSASAIRDMFAVPCQSLRLLFAASRWTRAWRTVRPSCSICGHSLTLRRMVHSMVAASQIHRPRLCLLTNRGPYDIICPCQFSSSVQFSSLLWRDWAILTLARNDSAP